MTWQVGPQSVKSQSTPVKKKLRYACKKANGVKCMITGDLKFVDRGNV